jgi:Kef-type K+ transport system membrane component KefB
MNATEILLLQIAVIVLLSRLLGGLMRLVGQPQVVGEMIAGIMLGPSVLGLIGRGVWLNALFPPAQMGNLEILTQLGVILFMFIVGLELEPAILKGQGKVAVAAAAGGIIVPFLFGMILGWALAGTPESQTGRPPNGLVLCLFMAAAMSITAFPVLARILMESNLNKTRFAAMALTCAAMVDCIGWCILALVLELARSNGFGPQAPVHGYGGHAALATLVLTGAYVLIMFKVVRPLLRPLQVQFASAGRLTHGALAVLFLSLIASSMATDAIGIHPVFGAFLLGAVMPKDARLVAHITGKFEDVTVVFLLPLFFAYTGLRTELGLLNSPRLWLICGLIVLTAVTGKLGGVSLAARCCGMSWRKSLLLGSLMNTRGLMELIILNIGLSLGILSASLFAMMVVMAVATTLMSSPLIQLLDGRECRSDDGASALRPEKGGPGSVD